MSGTGKHIEKYGVDIILTDLQKNPHCEHGPTVLFERFSAGKSSKYYGCSACRIRKLCPFYLPYSGKKSNNNFVKAKKQVQIKNRRNIFQEIDLSKYFFCATCIGVYSKCEIENHSKCKMVENLNKINVKFPTKILIPKNNSKFEAQYLFTDKTTAQIVHFIKCTKAEKVLCIGSPRIFEFLKNEQTYSPKCLLLDIDDRFYSFYTTEEYLKYNLFNNHFFDGKDAIDTFRSFLAGRDKIVILMDPPFGGRMELIANTLNLIEKEWNEVNHIVKRLTLSAILVLPYFLERSVNKCLPNFTMLDYQVDYDNHPLYTTGPKGMKNGSAVRLFVNLPSKLFPLPKSEGYRLCEKCDRWVFKNNIHCSKCQGCMSKDGKTYQHCDVCGKCVKPAWIHCDACKSCLPKDHNCSDILLSTKCHICGADSHKRIDCPKRKNYQKTNMKKKKRK